MSTTSTKSKKVSAKTVVPVPKYKVSQRIFVIYYHNGKPENLLEGEIVGRRTFEEEEFDSLGKRAGIHTTFTYTVRVASHLPISVRNFDEKEIIPGFVEAAKIFSTPFLLTIK